MERFVGQIDRWEVNGAALQARFWTGDGSYWPTLEDHPVLYLSIEGLIDADAVQAQLRELDRADVEVSVEMGSPTEITLWPEDGEPITLHGSQFAFRLSDFEIEDLQRVVRSQFDQIQSLHEDRKRNTSRFIAIRQALEEQTRRIAIKSRNHEPGSTASTLYKQHLEFVERLLEKLDT